jgi:hypothetical protein
MISMPNMFTSTETTTTIRIPEDSFIPEAPFIPFAKISRLFRPIAITEKIDGTNSAVVVSDTPPYGYGDEEVVGPGIVINTIYEDDFSEIWQPVYVYAQSRKQVIFPEKDNFGFATWVREHARELATGLGVGVHFGEWWGAGIQRKYGLNEKRFSLFNTKRWGSKEANEDGTCRPDCCHVVPVIEYADEFSVHAVRNAIQLLKANGSFAAPGFMDPEGVVTYHAASNQCFKTTIKDDEKGKDWGA